MTAAVAKDGGFAIVCLPQARPITVDLTRLSRSTDHEVRVAWFDPTTGESTRGNGSPFPPKTNRELIPPGKNALGDKDWVLILESVASAIPHKSGLGESAPR